MPLSTPYLSRKPVIFSANFDCRLSVRSRTACACCRKIFLANASASVFSAASFFIPVANPVSRKIINLSVQDSTKGKRKINLKTTEIMSTVHQTTPNGRMTDDDIMQRDSRFRYMLLSRLQSDCEYYLNYGNRHPKCLWAGNEERQIDFMIKLYDSFSEDEKPEWLTMDEIIEYSKKMIIVKE